MASRQILLVTKFAELWNGRFEAKVDELDRHIGKVDTKKNIDKSTEVHKIDSHQIIPFGKYKKPNYIDPFSFFQINN